MIVWCDGAHSPDENMRRDAALLERVESGALAGPVFRLFRFAPHGITLGASQDAAAVLDLGRCGRDGVPHAVRPTGGRAIFHAEEWTYAFAARADDPEWGGNLRESYAAVAAALIGSLWRLGVPVEPAPADRRGAEPAADASGGAACFAATAGHEIVLRGRKLLGSAQRRLSRAFLQQGSLLLGRGHLRLADYLRTTEERRESARAVLERRTADAGHWLGSAPLERWADALVAGFGAPARRLAGEEGLAALTLPESPSYTAPRTISPAAPSRRSP